MYIILQFSASYFAGLKRTGCRFNMLLLAAAGCLNLLLSANDLSILLSCSIILMIIHFGFLKINYEKKPTETAKRYLIISSVIFILALLSLTYIYHSTMEQTNYTNVAILLSSQEKTPLIFIAIMGLFMPFLYGLNIVPFHILSEEKTSKSILPSAHYFAIILPIVCWGVFIKLTQIITPTYEQEISLAYRILAFISIVFGAIGANARINLYRIFAYNSIYHFGIVLLLLSLLTPTAEFTAFIYLFLYLTALGCIYMVFYNIKSHGEYLSSVTSLSGLVDSRPHITGALLISLFSMLGLPPLAGFLGQLNVVYEFIKAEQYFSLCFVLFFMLLLAMSYLRIIKTVYFEQKIKNFDSENKYLMLQTWLGIFFIIAVMYNPFHLIEKLKDMFYVVFL
jgi:NADH-quinone oxidoreductase subunit N